MAEVPLLSPEVTAETPKPDAEADPNTPVEPKPEDTPEAKSDSEGDEKPVEGKGEEAPIEYEDFTLPEGLTVDEDLMGRFKEVAAKHRLPQEVAQELVSLQTEFMLKQVNAWEDMTKEWVASAKSDKEYGGANFDQNLAVAKAAVEAFGSEALVQALADTGAGNHPEMIRFMYKVGKAIKEDGFIRGDSQKSDKRTPEHILFPTMR